MQYFSIIQALCRSALANPSGAIIHQIERLISSLEKDGFNREAKGLKSILVSANKTDDLAPSRIERSRVSLKGEELSPNTVVPVDKESSTALAELIFPSQFPAEGPYFNTDVKLAIESILNEWMNFEKLESISAHPSKTCLIYGLPGTGKTHLAFWLAKQINLPIILAKLDGLMSSYLGTTSRNIGNLFAFAAKYRCILLLDEFDAIAKLRNDPQEVGEIKRVVNTLLQNLDIRKDHGFTIGITNHESLLDPAIWRRFEVQIEIPTPSIDVMASLIKKFLLPLKLEEAEVKFLTWAIESASGADAEALVKWLKKSFVLNKSEDTKLVDQIRKFSLLNSGRIDFRKRELLTGPIEELANALMSDLRYGFKQKEVAPIIGWAPSTLSKSLSKNKEYEKH